MRLFVAIDISDATRRELRRAREALQAELARARQAPRVTWVADEAAHVTIRFIGEVSETVAAQTRAVLAAPLRQAPYDIAFSGLGVFPNSKRPRVVWIGAHGGHAESEMVARLVDERLVRVVGAGEERAFRPHLTLGRVKESSRFDWDGVLARIHVGRSISRIDHVTLYQSLTTPKGPTYTALCTVPLVAA